FPFPGPFAPLLSLLTLSGKTCHIPLSDLQLAASRARASPARLSHLATAT
ncbi:hypothetical protein COCVIDRAFT_92892, partial [Bipolaris victoriae FI3]